MGFLHIGIDHHWLISFALISLILSLCCWLNLIDLQFNPIEIHLRIINFISGVLFPRIHCLSICLITLHKLIFNSYTLLLLIWLIVILMIIRDVPLRLIYGIYWRRLPHLQPIFYIILWWFWDMVLRLLIAKHIRWIIPSSLLSIACEQMRVPLRFQYILKLNIFIHL